jgi:putative ABC transport system substrate-binding protein
MNRRAFVTGLGAALAAPLGAEGQQSGKIYRIGHIAPPDFDRGERMEQRSWPAFIQGLANLGWIEGKNIVFDRRLATFGPPLQQAAEYFVRVKVDVIVLVSGARAQIVQRATRTIPIVLLSASDLVASGIVSSLARPGANITGMQNYAPELQGRRLQTLKELVPRLSQLAALRRGRWHPGMLAMYRRATEDAARNLGIRVRYVSFESADELAGVFAEIVNEGDKAVLIWSEPYLLPHLRQILQFAATHRLPTMAEQGDFVRDGALAGYGPKYDDMYRQAAGYVDRILRGAKPGDLPIGQPTTFDLAINLKTAKALSLTVPPSLLQRADQVIE